MYLDQSLLFYFTPNQMYKDVQNSNNVDKQMLNQLVNENEKNIIKNDTVQKKGKILCHKDTAENHVKILAQ